MRFWVSIWLLFVIARGWAQCIEPQFSVLNADNLCRQSPVRVVNEGDTEGSYYWDFCPETFEGTPVVESNAINSSGQIHGYKVIRHEGQWYGFLVSRSLDKLLRLDFGGSPLNTPTVTDLGNPGGLMDAPEGIDFFKEGDEWFAFVGKGENSTGQVVKLSFGTDLTSVPDATGYGTFGLGSVRIRDLRIVKQDDDIILVMLVYNSGSLNRVNFGNSLDNLPGANSVVSIPGATLPRGIDMIMQCEEARAHIVCENGTVLQVSFGDDVLGPVTVEGTFNFESVIQPWRVRTFFSGGKYYSFVSCNNRKYAIIDFGDLSLQTPPVDMANPTDSRLIGLDVVKYEGMTIVQGGSGGGALLSATYRKDCGLITDFSEDYHPTAFTYSTAASYAIDLTLFDNDIEFSSVSKTVVINDADAPAVEIGYEGMCQGGLVSFTSSNSDPVLSWSWDFGNGSTDNAPSPQTSYALSGEYTVVLDAIATNSCLAGDEIKVKIYEPPVADFSIPSGLMCTNNEFTFSTTTPDEYDGNLDYQWLVNAVEVSTDRNLQYTFNSPGIKEITLRTSIPGCSDEEVKNTLPVEAGPVVDFSFTGTCEDESFSFESDITGDAEGYSWDFGDGNTSTGPLSDHAFSDFGTYDVSLTVSNAAGCQNTASKAITVHAVPVVDFRIASPVACSGIPTRLEDQSAAPDGDAITTWLWDFADPADPMVLHDQSPRHTFTEPGTYPVSLTATTAAGCTSSAIREIDVNRSPSTDFTYTTACEDLPVIFTPPQDNTIDDWYWEIGTSYYITASPSHTFKAAGDYPLLLEVTATNGCIATARKVIHVPAPLAPDFFYLKNCVGQEAILEDITTGTDPVVNQEWTFDTGETFTGSPIAFAFPTAEKRTITMKVTGASGCSYPVTKVIDVLPAPVANFEANPGSGAYPLEVRFANNSTGATDYVWSFNDGTGAASTEASPVYTFQGQGSFDVELRAFNEQQCESVFTGTVTAVAPLPDAQIETVTLSPNDDGSFKLIVTVHNNGNTILKELPLELDFSGILNLRQIVQEPIMPGAKFNYVFSTGVAGSEIVRYLCVSADVENDLHPDDNRICEKLDDDLVVFQVFPNPVMGTLTLEWIGISAGEARVTLTDALGRAVLDVVLPGTEGLNRKTIDVSGMENGIYYLKVAQGDAVKMQKIAISAAR